MVAQFAQRGDRVLELRDRRRVVLRDDEIDLMREVVDRVSVTDQVFRRHQPAHGVADFGQPVLDAAERGGVDAGLAAFDDAAVETLDLLFDGFERAARHRVAERAADFGELLAQRVDRLFDAGLAQRFDLIGDVAQLIFQAGQILRRQGRLQGGLGGRRLPARRRGNADERALSRRDFSDGAVEVRRQPHARDLRRL